MAPFTSPQVRTWRVNELIKVNNVAITMTSLELVEFINNQRKEGEAVLRHDHFMVKVPKVLGEVAAPNFRDSYKGRDGTVRPCYRFPKREACLMAMSYSYELQAKVFDRMTELETIATSSRPALPDFTNPAVAARAWADEVEAKQAALVQLEAAKPSVEFVQKYAEAESTKCLGDVAKVLGHKPHAFSKKLAEDNVIFKRDGVWIPKQVHVDAGRFTVRVGVRHGFAFNQIRVTPKGVVWLAQKYGPLAGRWVAVDRGRTQDAPRTQPQALHLIILSFLYIA